MSRGASIGALALALLAMGPRASVAVCLDPPGDVDASGTTSVTDVQCLLLASLWALGDPAGPAPGCLAVSPNDADLDCKGGPGVVDVYIGIYTVLHASLPPATDADGDGCADACCAAARECCINAMFEEGFGGPGDSAFAFEGTSAASKWQVWSGGKSHSSPAALYYGNTAKQSFDDGKTAGTATTPWLVVPPAPEAALTFWLYMDAEATWAFDRLDVHVLHGGSKTKVWTKTKYTAGGMKVWKKQTVDLTPFAGSMLRVAFSFDSVDGVENVGEGVYVDDLRVTIPCAITTGCTTDGECNDGNVCTKDFCIAGFGCANVAGGCDDGDACTIDTCVPAAGCLHAAKVCGDGNACTADSCDSGKGCIAKPITCDDGDPCTLDGCAPSSGCTAAPTICDDDDSCTADSCEPGIGCLYLPIPAPECCVQEALFEPFDIGTATGFTFSGTSSLSKWQVTGAGKFKSGPSALYYGNVAKKNYDDGASSGTARGPEVVLPSQSAAALTFWLLMDTEGGTVYDKLTIRVLGPKGKSAPVWAKAAYGAQMKVWKKQTVDLGAFAGQAIQLEWAFDTVDSLANTGEGVYVDDVRIFTPCGL